MSKYLELFKGSFDDSINEKTKPENKPYVTYSIKEDRVAYTVVPKPADPNTYVTFTAKVDNSSIGLTKLSTNQTLEYSTDTITWNTFNTTTNIPLNNGNEVYIRGILIADNTNSNYTQFKMSGKIAARGNCNAIWNYQDLNAPLKEFCGWYMFENCTSLTTAPELPATVLAKNCYGFMFDWCSSLTTAPELSATTLANYCYQYMFQGCASLIAAPELPATTLADGCYSDMFDACTSLTTAPELPATTLADGCYSYMFKRCRSLTTPPKLPATELTGWCYMGMFSGCFSLTTAPELPATTLTEGCYRDMFNSCTSLTKSPELPAAILTKECYSDMFQGCAKLSHITCLANDISSALYCTSNWVKGVSSTGTFIKHPNMNGWATGTSGIPNGWTVEDAVL